MVRRTDRGDPRRRRARRGGGAAPPGQLRRGRRTRGRSRGARPALGRRRRAAASTSSTSTAPAPAGCGPSSCAPSAAAGLPVQASGGIRTLADARALLDAGADRVIVGTAAWPDPTPLVRARRGARPRARRARRPGAGGGLDRVGRHLARRRARARSASRRVLVTAIDRDGTLAGPDLELVAAAVGGRGAGPRRRRRPFARPTCAPSPRQAPRPRSSVAPCSPDASAAPTDLSHWLGRCSIRQDSVLVSGACGGQTSNGRRNGAAWPRPAAPPTRRSAMHAALPFLDSPARTELRSERRTAPSPGELTLLAARTCGPLQEVADARRTHLTRP